MNDRPINIRDKLSKFDEHWTPKIVAELNDYQVKVVKLAGEFIWHSHADTDEMFLCIAGSLTIRFRDGSVTLEEGDLFVVPKGVEHMPIAHKECHALIIEPRGVINTGDAGGSRTAPNDDWI